MAVKKYKPTSPGRRGMTGNTFEALTTKKPQRKLIAKKGNHGGRNAQGRITVRHRGGGH
jgi:large subunit ribosomal protein L2